jgi:hypothetical protein
MVLHSLDGPFRSLAEYEAQLIERRRALPHRPEFDAERARLDIARARVSAERRDREPSRRIVAGERPEGQIE